MKRPLPPTYFFVFLGAALALHFLIPVRHLISLPWCLTGAVPVALGLWLLASADRLFKAHGTTVKPFRESTAIVTTGPFHTTARCLKEAGQSENPGSGITGES